MSKHNPMRRTCGTLRDTADAATPCRAGHASLASGERRTAASSMARKSTDFLLASEQLVAARAAIEAWDARYPWTADPRPEEFAITRAFNAACAPR